MPFAMIQLVAFQLLLPAIFLFILWRGDFKSKLQWGIQVLAVAMYITWIVLSGRWDWLGYYLRYVWVVAALVVFYFSWRSIRTLPMTAPLTRGQKWYTAIDVFILLIFGLYNVFIFNSYTAKEEAIELSFPLKEGTYYVGHGGSHVQMNYHHAYLPQQYALDIAKLNGFGTRANGLYPEDLEKYEIYGDQLYSPCSGEVTEQRDGLPDLTPPEADREHLEGNFVALACDSTDAILYIAHMQEGSVAVQEGERIEEGELIGRVGNSGNTSEPHLHIHAEREGEGVPLQFDGDFLVRNELVR